MSGAVEAKLSALAAGQWGLLTTAQASALGVPRSTIMRREKSGSLERLRHGVYRLTGSPAHRLDDIRAAWVASDLRTPAWERMAEPDVVVGGAAAAWAHEIGDLPPSPYLLYSKIRRQTSSDDVRYSARHLPAEDVTLVEGLPVTTRERTIADLVNEADLSLVADALGDAERASTDLDAVALLGHLDVHARRLEYATGSDLYAALRTRTGNDAARLQDLLLNTDLIDRLHDAINAQLRQALSPFGDDLAASLRTALPPLQQQAAQQARDIVTSAVRDQLRAAATVRLPRVQLPSFALPQFSLSLETQAAIRDLAQHALQRGPGLPDRPGDDIDGTADRERTAHGNDG